MGGAQPAADAKFTASGFPRRLVAELPELSGDVAFWGDDIGAHVLVGEFLAFTQKAIQAGDLSLVRRCFSSAEQVFSSADYYMWNAIAVSHLEHLDFSGICGQRAKELLPAPLVAGFNDLDEYMTALLGADWTEDKVRRGW